MTTELFDGKAARDFFTALQVDPATVHYRGIHWNKELPKSQRGVHVTPSGAPQQQNLENLQQQGYRLYWVPNGGKSDDDAPACRFLFVEWDDHPLEWQLTAWRELGLPEPTAMVNTGGKSIHCYWRLAAPIPADAWRDITTRLIEHCGSDRSCKNPSRLMRLPGGTYIYKSDDTDAAGNSLGGTYGPNRAAVVVASGASYDVAAIVAALPPIIEPPAPVTPPSYVAPIAPVAGAMVTPDDPRTYEELERMVAAYPPILADNDQYDEAIAFIFGLCKAMEEIGRSRSDAIALASRYHPGAADTFEEARKAKIDKSQGGSFVKQCKAKGVDVRRHDIARKPEVHIDPADQAMERPTGNGHHPPATIAAPAPWEAPMAAPVDPEDQEAKETGAAALLAAGREPITLADVLPAGLAGPLTERAAAFPCDPTAFLLPLLCTTASVIGNRVKIRVKKTWQEPFVLWGANVMPASSLKSPIAGVMSSALGKWQVEINKAAKSAKDKWTNERNRVALQSDADALKQWDEENPPPLPARELFIVDATLERIGQFLGQNSTPGMIAYHDELSLWFQQLKRGKDAMDQRSNWLSLWNGKLLRVDRVGRESIYVPNTAQSVFGLATVDGLAEIRGSKKASNGNQDADGLWARFLMWRPDDVPYEYNELDRDVTDLLCDLFRNRIDAKLPEPGESLEQPQEITLSRDAIATMKPHWNAWYRESNATTTERGQWIGKLRGHSVRIAGVLHVLDHAVKELPIVSEISAGVAKRALHLCYALLDQYDLLCPRIGGDTGALDPAVAKLLTHGIDWRKEHGKAPVPGHHIRSTWNLPERKCKAATTNEWLLREVGAIKGGALGWVEPLPQGVQWHPPK